LNVSAIILAAGSSSRMGQSKQLLTWGNHTLLRHAVLTALRANVQSVYVVLGSNAQAHQKEIEDLNVVPVINHEWERGMGSSLKVGLTQAMTDSDAVLLMVCDQPLISTGHLNAMAALFEEKHHKLIASEYNDTIGVPALFGREWYDELMNIPDEQGARTLIAAHGGETYLVKLYSGEDVDTPEDYRRLIQPQ